MNDLEIAKAIRGFVAGSYPSMDVRVEPWDRDPSRRAIYFVEEKFSLLYPQQRFHYLTHLLPRDFQERELVDSVWFELAPGEKPEELQYPDEEFISEISELVMAILLKTDFFGTLDRAFTRESDPAICWGDFRVAKSILPSKGVVESEYFDVFHVLMARGGFCDCEILYNVSSSSEFAARYWRSRSSPPGHL